MSVPRTKQPLSKPIILHLNKTQLNIQLNRQGTAVKEKQNRVKGSILDTEELV